MNFLSFYQSNIYYELLNKFNYFNLNTEFQIQKLIISIKLNQNSLPYIIQNLLILEILFFKKSFYLTVKTGTYFWLNIHLKKKKHINLFLIKYLWLIYPKIKNQQNNLKINTKLKKKNKMKSLFYFKFDYFKELEYIFNIYWINIVTFDINFKYTSSKKLLFFRKSFQLLKTF